MQLKTEAWGEAWPCEQTGERVSQAAGQRGRRPWSGTRLCEVMNPECERSAFLGAMAAVSVLPSLGSVIMS